MRSTLIPKKNRREDSDECEGYREVMVRITPSPPPGVGQILGNVPTDPFEVGG